MHRHTHKQFGVCEYVIQTRINILTLVDDSTSSSSSRSQKQQQQLRGAALRAAPHELNSITTARAAQSASPRPLYAPVGSQTCARFMTKLVYSVQIPKQCAYAFTTIRSVAKLSNAHHTRRISLRCYTYKVWRALAPVVGGVTVAQHTLVATARSFPGPGHWSSGWLEWGVKGSFFLSASSPSAFGAHLRSY